MTDKKMNPEVKRKWVEALRSGQYEQLKESLYDGKKGDVTLCCALGVLNDVSGLGQWQSDAYVVDEFHPAIYRSYFDPDTWQDCVLNSLDEVPDFRKFVIDYDDDEARIRLPTKEEVQALSPEAREHYRHCLLGEDELLHTVVADWAGMDSREPFLVVDGQRKALHTLNDSGMSFESLADLIEEQL